MTTQLTYSTGTPIQVGDLVKRSAAAKAIYRVAGHFAHDSAPVLSLAPHSGYTSASAFGDEQIAKLVLVEAVRRAV